MRKRVAALGLLMMTSAGCTSTDIRWDPPQSVAPDSGVAGSGGEGGTRRTHSGASRRPDDAASCDTSFVFAVDGKQIFAAWLRLKPDSSAAVVAARSDDGIRWSSPAVVDSVDVGRFGCARPGPSIAAADGYVHVAYSLKAPEGYGVFFAHSMDQAATFHSPMIVVYGDRLSATSTAARGMQVVVAYEEPSGQGRAIGVAPSRTQGHTFERRLRASPDNMDASLPRVALDGRTIALSFASGAGSTRVMRIGHLP